MKRQMQIQFPLEQPRFPLDAGKVQAGRVSQFHVDADVARTAFDGEPRDCLPVIALEAFRQTQHAGQNARFFSLVTDSGRRRALCAALGSDFLL